LRTDENRPGFEQQFRKCALLIALYAIPPFLVVAAIGVLDADLWWHLRTGQWIFQHKSIIQSDHFSWTEMGKPWAAYSWLFEVLIYGLFEKFGLVGILAYTYAVVLAITVALHSLIRQFEKRLAQTVGLTALAMIAMTRICSPRPWLFTILFFCLELNILLSVRRSRNFRKLLLLLPIFALWANLHIQFVYGILLLLLATVEEPLNIVLRRAGVMFDDTEDKALPVLTTGLITLVCALALAVNPYHFKIYGVLLDTIHLAGLYGLISEMQALPFRTLPDWLVLFLTLLAAFGMGRRRTGTPFWILLLASACFVSFRGNRDVWFVVIVAVTLIAKSFSINAEPQSTTKLQMIIVGVVIIGMLAVTVSAYRISNIELQKMVDENYPHGAVTFVQEHGLTGPLYNHSNWGGYLIWQLPGVPVAIDGRGNLHSPEHLSQAFSVWRGEPGWDADPNFKASRLIIAEKRFPLAQLLRLDQRFQLVYEDPLSVVFVIKE
jgi:hypothetical protein